MIPIVKKELLVESYDLKRKKKKRKNPRKNFESFENGLFRSWHILCLTGSF